MKWVFLLAPIAACSFGDNLVQHEDPRPDAAIAGQHDAPEVAIDASMVQPQPDAPAPLVCELVPQAGCSGVTPACDLSGADDGTVACRGVTKQGVSNSHCSAPTECKAGYTCIDGPEADDAPYCSRFCAVDADCVGIGSRCVDAVADGTDQIPICSHACDPYAQTGCPSGMGCIGATDAAGDYSDCEYMGAVADGDACVHVEDCELGSTCVTDGASTTCEAYCLVGDDSTCDGELTCNSFATPLVIDGVEYGACD